MQSHAQKQGGFLAPDANMPAERKSDSCNKSAIPVWRPVSAKASQYTLSQTVCDDSLQVIDDCVLCLSFRDIACYKTLCMHVATQQP